LQKAAYETRMLAKSKEIERMPGFEYSRDSNYKTLLEMTQLLSKEIGLKRDAGYLFGEHERDESYNSDTDEKLVAMLYRLSLAGKNSCLLAEDVDFIRLLGVITRMIGSDYFLPHNAEFREKIAQNPFRFYLKSISQKCYLLKIDSSKIRYSEDFNVRTAPQKRNTSIREQIAQLWKSAQH
jgi:hypothetical protein